MSSIPMSTEITWHSIYSESIDWPGRGTGDGLRTGRAPATVAVAGWGQVGAGWTLIGWLLGYGKRGSE